MLREGKFQVSLATYAGIVLGKATKGRNLHTSRTKGNVFPKLSGDNILEESRGRKVLERLLIQEPPRIAGEIISVKGRLGIQTSYGQVPSLGF